MRVTAIIQARMGSTRLPGKVLLEVSGKPLLAYLIERLRRAKHIKNIILATSNLPQDNPIASFCRSENIKLFRGDESDVLDRYYRAACQVQAEHIMRITGDCPLIDPNVCDFVVDSYFERSVDYVHTAENFAEGLDCEVFSFDALKRSWEQARLFSEREHVTLYIRNNPEKFTFFVVNNTIDDSWIRITIDCKEDFDVVKNIILSAQKEKKQIDMIYIRDFLKNNRDVFRINADIIRNEGLLKSLKNDNVVTEK